MPELEPLVPLDYQERDIEQIVAHDGTGLIVSAVGGRKTLVAVESAIRTGSGTILVIAPQGTLKRGWQRTIERQTGSSDGSTARVVRLDSTKKGKQYLQELYFGEPGWYLCTPQWFARQTWLGFEPDMAIFDEIHIAGNYQNKTRAALHQLSGAKRRLGLSGTPLRNKFENAWGIVRWIYPELMPLTFWEWRRTKCAGVWDRFASQNFKVTGELEPGTLMNSLPCYIQHLAREYCCEFHPNGFLAELKEPEEVVRTVEMTPNQKRFYTAMEKNYVAWLTTPDDSGRLPVVAELPITAHGILRMCALGMPSVDEDGSLYYTEDCESPKLDDLLEMVEELDGAPAIIYTHSRKFMVPLRYRLETAGYSMFEWSGANSQKKRDAAMEEFIDGDVDYIAAVITAIGTGTDGLQEATNVEHWLSEDEDGTANEQARGRTDRPGQTRRVLRIKYQAEGTDDEGIVSKQIERALAMNKIMRKRMKQ